MVELPLQLQTDGKTLAVMSQDDCDKLKEFHINQIVRAKITGVKKPRSVIQLNLYWAKCTYVAILVSDHENQFDKDDIDFEVKVKVAKKKPALIKHFKSVDGMTYVALISTSFPNMEHLDACKYYSAADKEFEKMTKIDPDELTRRTKERMGPRGGA